VEEKMKEVLESIVRTDKDDSENLIRFDLKKLEPYTDQDSYLYELFYKYGFRNWADIRSLCKAQSGKQVLSNTHRLVKHGQDLILGEISTRTKEDSFEISKGDQILQLDQFQLVFDIKDEPDTKSTLASFDKDLLRFPLLVRKWKKGDYFYPIGMKGRKKLSKYFKDEKFSLFQKENIWLLCSGNDVIWVIGKRIDDRYKITDQTNNIYHIVIQQ
jgi:tRNA(Ile)-lysidine synthase